MWSWPRYRPFQAKERLPISEMTRIGVPCVGARHGGRFLGWPWNEGKNAGKSHGHLWKSMDIYWNLLKSIEIYGHLLKSIEIYGHLSTSQGKNRKKQSFRDGTCISESLGSLSEGNIFWENEFGFPIFRHLNGCPKWVTRCGWYGHSLALHQSISWTSLFLRGSYGKC